MHSVRSADELLDSGIADYTFIPGEEGVLGRGKFSTVYKVKDSDGRHVRLWLDTSVPPKADERGHCAGNLVRSETYTSIPTPSPDSGEVATRTHLARTNTTPPMPYRSTWMDQDP